MLRYTTETVSKYWDHEDYRIFTLKMNESGNLILISSNLTNSSLFDFPETCNGKSLYEIMEKEHADRWHERFYQWKENGLTSYLAYFQNCSIAWDTTIEIINDTVFGIGEKMDSAKFNSGSFEKHEFFNQHFIHQEDFIIITLLAEPEQDSYIIDSIDSTFAPDLNDFLGKDISSLIFYCSNLLDKEAYKKCLQTKRRVQFVEKFIKDDQTVFLDVTLYPYMNNKKIGLFAKIINEPLYHKMQKTISNISSLYPELSDHGLCEINCSDQNNPYMIGCNNFFKNILEKNNLELSSLVFNHTFQNCLKTLSTESGDLVIQNDLGEFKYFKINVTHISEMQNYVFLVSLTPLEKETIPFDLSLTNLSNREKEVLQYVVNGLTNRYIATILNVTEGTIKKTVHNGYKKLGICSRIELIKLIYHE